MNILIVHDAPALDEAAAAGHDVPWTVALSHVRSPELQRLIAEADCVAVVASLETGAADWEAARRLIAARDVPLGTVKMMPSSRIETCALCGTCTAYESPDRELEVACLVQQLALDRMARLLRGETDGSSQSGKGNESKKGRKVTRFVYQKG